MTTPLAELIRAHCDRTGETLSDVAARGSLSRQTLSALVNRDAANQLPRASTLRKLATGLGLPFETVRKVAATAAYGEADGHSERQAAQVLAAYAERLPDRDLEVLLATARALELASLMPPDGGGGGTKTATRPKQKHAKPFRPGLSVIR